MAEYADRYEVGSLESTERQYTDYEVVKRLMKDFVLKQGGLFHVQLVLILIKMVTAIAGPYIPKITLDYFIQNTPSKDGKWLADLIISFSDGSIESILLAAAMLYVFISLFDWIITSIWNYYSLVYIQFCFHSR